MQDPPNHINGLKGGPVNTNLLNLQNSLDLPCFYEQYFFSRNTELQKA